MLINFLWENLTVVGCSGQFQTFLFSTTVGQGFNYVFFFVCV